MYRANIRKCLGCFLRPNIVLTQRGNFKLTQTSSANFIERFNFNSRCLHSAQIHCIKMASASGKSKSETAGVMKKSEKPLRAVRIREHKQRVGEDKWPTVSLQILGSGTKDINASVMIIAGTSRYSIFEGKWCVKKCLESSRACMVMMV